MKKQISFLKYSHFMIILCAVILSACQTNFLAHQGFVKFKIPAISGFRTQFIPPETQQFQVTITGEGIFKAEPVIHTFGFSQANQSQTIKLPMGDKLVTVNALSSNQTILATGSSSIKILPGKTVQAEITLEEAKRSLILPIEEVAVDNDKAKPPEINAFGPIEGGAGTIVYITGENFELIPEKNFVFFGNTAARVIQRSNEFLIVEAPANVNTGKIKVITSGGKVESNLPFQVIGGRQEPFIEDFEPKAAPTGAIVTIIGENFDFLNPTQNIVTFNDVKARFVSIDKTRIVVRVPQGNVTGKIKITNRFGSGLSAGNFVLLQ